MNRDTRPVVVADPVGDLASESLLILARAELLSVRCETEITDVEIASLFEDME